MVAYVIESAQWNWIMEEVNGMLREAERWSCEGERRTCIGQNGNNVLAVSGRSYEGYHLSRSADDALVHLSISYTLCALTIPIAEYMI